MYARSRCQIVRVDFSFLKSSQRHAALAANTARNRQHGAPTRRGGAVDWLHPWWREEPLKLKKPLYDRVWWVETSTACTRPSASMWHGSLMEVVEQAYVSACRCVLPAFVCHSVSLCMSMLTRDACCCACQACTCNAYLDAGSYSRLILLVSRSAPEGGPSFSVGPCGRAVFLGRPLRAGRLSRSALWAGRLTRSAPEGGPFSLVGIISNSTDLAARSGRNPIGPCRQHLLCLLLCPCRRLFLCPCGQLQAATRCRIRSNHSTRRGSPTS